MAVVAVINRKGGSGKSTLATHLAGYCSHAGAAVMLGDIDRQLSTQTWLRQRKTRDPATKRIVGWNIDPRRFVRPPAGIDHVIVDTPGGLRGFDLARVVMYADAVLIPVCNSIFDRESAKDCLEELRALPRIANGRCKLAAVGMRVDARTKSAQVLESWAATLNLPFIGVLRESQTYVRCIEHGLSVFDLPARTVQADLAQWEPIVAWLRPVMQAGLASAVETQRKRVPTPAISDPVMSDAAASERAQHPSTPASPLQQHPPRPSARTGFAATTWRRLREALPLAAFLHRTQ